MTSLLDIIQDERIARQRRGEAECRRTCDQCGTPFRAGYFTLGHGGGWGMVGRTVFCGHDARWYAVCSDRCYVRLAAWLTDDRGGVPRLIGRETVARTLEEEVLNVVF